MCSTGPESLLPFTQFADPSDTTNGLCMNNIFIPEEIVFHILTYVEPTELLKCSLVCHKWNKLVKSYALWSKLYKRRYNRTPKDLPWFLYYCVLSTSYFDTNVLVNEEGQDAFVYWKLAANTREFSEVVTDYLVKPKYSSGDIDMLTLKMNTHLKVLPPFSCRPSPNFFEEEWLVKLTKNKLFLYILDNYRPNIYVANCGYLSQMRCESLGQELGVNTSSNPYFTELKDVDVGIVILEYPEGIRAVLFEQTRNAFKRCRNLNEGILKFVFDSIEPLSRDDLGNICPKKVSNQFVFEKLPEDELPDESYLY